MKAACKAWPFGQPTHSCRAIEWSLINRIMTSYDRAKDAHRSCVGIGRSPTGRTSLMMQHARLYPRMSFFRQDRQSVVEGKSVSVRVDIGGRRIIKKKQHITKKQ